MLILQVKFFKTNSLTIVLFNSQAFIPSNFWAVGPSMAQIMGMGKSGHLPLELGLLLFLDTLEDATHESHSAVKGEAGLHPFRFLSS